MVTFQIMAVENTFFRFLQVCKNHNESNRLLYLSFVFRSKVKGQKLVLIMMNLEKEVGPKEAVIRIDLMILCGLMSLIKLK